MAFYILVKLICLLDDIHDQLVMFACWLGDMDYDSLVEIAERRAKQ